MADNAIARTFPPIPSLAESWGFTRPHILAQAGADPVEMTRKSLNRIADLRESDNELVAFKAAECELKVVGAFAPPPEIDRTPRFAVQINLEQPKPAVEALPAVDISAKAIPETTTGRSKRSRKSTT